VYALYIYIYIYIYNIHACMHGDGTQSSDGIIVRRQTDYACVALYALCRGWLSIASSRAVMRWSLHACMRIDTCVHACSHIRMETFMHANQIHTHIYMDVFTFTDRTRIHDLMITYTST
jgi:hypothetical protein